MQVVFITSQSLQQWQGGYSKPRNLSKNMSNEEYLQMLEQQNQEKRRQEQIRNQERKKLEERERGFNTYLQGANEDLPKKRQTNHSNTRVRRQWRDSSKSNEREEHPVSNNLAQKAYHNPFDLGSESFADKTNPGALVDIFGTQKGQSSMPQVRPGAGQNTRKTWGERNQEARQQIDVKDDEDDEYSDDDFVNEESDLQIIQEQTTENSVLEQSGSAEQNHIELFLKTASAKDMDIIRESLSNFQEASKNFSNFKQQEKAEAAIDEQIEEEYEEDIPEDTGGGGSEEEEELKFEKIKQSRPSGKSRPVSAVYDLSQARSGNQTQRTLNHGAASAAVLNTGGYVPPATVKKDYGSKFEQQSLKGAAHTGIPYTKGNMHQSSLSNFGSIQGNKPNVNNPFRRPYSEVNPGSRLQSKFHLPVPTAQQNNYNTQVSTREVDNIDESFGGVSKLSKKETELNYIIQAIQNLDDSARQDLVALLSQKQSRQGSQYSVTGKYPQMSSYTNTMNTNNPMTDTAIPKINALPSMNELRIRVITTHGDPHLCGLTEVELFDSQAKKMVILPTNVTVRNQGRHGPSMSARSLVNGLKFTNEHRNMWIGSLPLPQSPPLYLELVINYGLDLDLAAVKIWNYNKSFRDGTKGVRDIELYVNDQIKYEGQVKMGKGSTSDDYSQLITIKEGCLLSIEEAKNEETIEVSINDEDINLHGQKQQKAIQIQKEVSDYGQVPQQQKQLRAAPRNIDIIRQRNRSKSPIEEAKDQRPVWLKPTSQNQQVRAQADPARDSRSREKLNRRQMEQKLKQEADHQTPAKTKNLIEESLDSFDFFKVTNLGRINNDNGPQSQQRQSKNSNRAKWGQKVPSAFEQKKEEATLTSDLSSKDSIRASYKAPRIMKSPFPDEFCMPSPALSHKKSASRASVRKDPKLEEEDLLLEEVMGKSKEKIKIDLEEDTFEKELKSIGSTPALTKEQIFQDKLDNFKKMFIIPELPQGSTLEFNVLQTWGDLNYLGLTGIEVFDEQGNKVSISDITAVPSDINLLMGYGTDPRTVDKLVDEVQFTNDDFHAWLTPFTLGDDHTITIKLPRKLRISMIRIWNYNKSRIHSHRGARLVTCELDSKLIFRGEIARAAGDTVDPAACCEIILFTDDDEILERIDRNDWLNQVQTASEEDTNVDSVFEEQSRPMTATKKFTDEEIQNLQSAFKKPTSMFDERPQTKAVRRINPPPMIGNEEEFDHNEKPNENLEDFKPKILKKDKKAQGGVKGRVLELNISESWGDLFYVGLNGIEVYDTNGNKIELSIHNITAEPRDMNSIPGHGSDHRTLDKLINSVNNTCDDKNMWLIPFNSGEDHWVKIDLGRMTSIGSIKFYNYNKSMEDSLRGAKQLTLKLDGKLISPSQGITLRKAPGFVLPNDSNMCNDFGQVIQLPFAEGWKANQILPITKQVQNSSQQIGLQQEYEPICMPVGFTFRINLYSTHGDNYYIGLNGLELYDQLGNLIAINPTENVMVNPPGVNRISGMENDQRTLQKLFNGKNQTFDDENMWLAPFKFTRSHAAANSQQQNSDKREPNFIYIMFDTPKALGALRLWNYSKTAARGVHEFELIVDDNQIYRGFAKKAPESQHEWEKSFQKDFSTSVIFNNERVFVERFKNTVHFDGSKEQEVLMFNERKQLNQRQMRPNEKFVFNEKERPMTKYGGAF